MTIQFPAQPDTTRELLERIEQHGSELDELLASLSEAKATTVLVAWSVKDHVAHLGCWHGAASAALTGEPRYKALGLETPPADPRDFDSINATLYERWKNKPLADVREFFRTSQNDVAQRLQQVPDEDLKRPVEATNPDGATLLQVVCANTYEHYIEHLVWIRQQMERASL